VRKLVVTLVFIQAGVRSYTLKFGSWHKKQREQ
jgi:hypothetical protein